MPAVDLLTRDPKMFWQLRPPDDQVLNPLGFTCAPNATDPSYASCHSLHDFLAFGFVRCWFEPDEIPDYWQYVERDDIKWLREYFLRAVESALLLVYAGDIVPGAEPGLDWTTEDSLTIGPEDANSDLDDGDVLDLRWVCDRVDGDCLLFLLVAGPVAGNDLAQWLAIDAILDLRRARAAIADARQKNALAGNLDECSWSRKRWAKLRVPNVEPEYRSLKDTPASFDIWYDKNYGDRPQRCRRLRGFPKPDPAES